MDNMIHIKHTNYMTNVAFSNFSLNPYISSAVINATPIILRSIRSVMTNKIILCFFIIKTSLMI